MGVGSLKAKTKTKTPKSKKTLAASALQDCKLPHKMGVFLPNDAPYSPEYENHDASEPEPCKNWKAGGRLCALETCPGCDDV